MRVVLPGVLGFGVLPARAFLASGRCSARRRAPTAA